MERHEWDEAISAKIYTGSEVDLKDGFIHFSTKSQVEETVSKHFRGKKNLVLIKFHDSDMGDRLKWEPSRGGEMFPHLYSDLDPSLHITLYELTDTEDGGHLFPDEF